MAMGFYSRGERCRSASSMVKKRGQKGATSEENEEWGKGNKKVRGRI
jgi:hypothetical protein